MQHAGKGNVVDIERLAGDFLAAFLARRGFADGVIVCIRIHRDTVLYNLNLLNTQAVIMPKVFS